MNLNPPTKFPTHLIDAPLGTIPKERITNEYSHNVEIIDEKYSFVLRDVPRMKRRKVFVKSTSQKSPNKLRQV